MQSYRQALTVTIVIYNEASFNELKMWDMKNESIDKIEKAVENILPISSAFINELDYSVIEQKKADWLKLSELAHSIVLVFDCCTKNLFLYQIIFLSYTELILKGYLSTDMNLF